MFTVTAAGAAAGRILHDLQAAGARVISGGEMAAACFDSVEVECLEVLSRSRTTRDSWHCS